MRPPRNVGAAIRQQWTNTRALLGGRGGPVTVLAVVALLAGIAESGILAIVAQGAGALVSGASRVALNIGPVRLHKGVEFVLLVAIGLAGFRLALQGLLSIIPARIAADLQARTRSAVFAAFTRASWSVQSRDREGHLQEILTSQTNQAVQASLQAAMLVVTLTSFVMLVLSALVLDPIGALIVLAAAIGLAVALRPLTRLGTQSAQALSRAGLRYAGGVSEAVRLAAETRVFGVDEAQRRQLDGLINEVRGPFYRTQMLIRLVPGIYQSVIYLLVAAALLILYLSGTGHVASLGAVVLLLVRAGSYGQQAQSAYQSVRQAMPFFERVRRTQERYEASVRPPANRPLEEVQTIAFDGVTFAYEAARPVLEEISFEVSPRETIGIIGPTGAGKSTLVQILLGLREPTSGRYLVNGVLAEEFDRQQWHRRISHLPQEPRLLHASVAENIRFFRDLDAAAVERAARLAEIHDDIMKWPDGYATIVGPRADAVSGGQQQRICLARALATEPELLILDEPTSAVDPRTELLIQESLAALRQELTLFIVAHRMSMLSICDRVMVVVDGRLEAFDTADALTELSGYYRTASGGTRGAEPVRPVPPPSVAQSY